MNEVNQRLFAACKELLAHAQRVGCPPGDDYGEFTAMCNRARATIAEIEQEEARRTAIMDAFQLAVRRIEEVRRQRAEIERHFRAKEANRLITEVTA